MTPPPEPGWPGPRDPTLASGGTSTSADAPAADAGTPLDGRLGRFVVLRQIGMGGMGVVYSAYDELLGRRVALKLVRTDRHGGDAHDRILQEAQALACLSHPNVVQLYEVSAAAGRVFIAMEYVEGRTLRRWTDERRAAGARRRELLEMYLQAGRGLAAAHAGGLVHRDFKPDNVLVGDDGRARVVDFGLVAARDPTRSDVPIDARPSLTVEGAVLGTPPYMAPEQLAGRPVDARSDQFSFCVALHEALTGARPFVGGDLAELRRSVAAGVPRAAPGVLPEWLLAVVRRGLAVRPEDRFATMDELLAALARDPEAVRRRRLRIAALALGSALFAALVVALAVVLRQRASDSAREAAAERALASVEARIAEARAAGEPTPAAVFAGFVEDPLHDGTAALAQAWLAEAGRRRVDGDPAGARAAFAAAHVRANTASEQREALLGLARLFRDRLEWDPLAHLLDLLGRDHPDLMATPELAALRVDAALARRDLAAVRALRTGDPVALAVADALVGATATPHRGIEQVLLGADQALLVEHWFGRHTLHVAGPGPDLPLRHSLPLADTTQGIRLFAGGDTSLAIAAQWADNVVYRADAGGIAEVHRWNGAGAIVAASADLDDDGVRELYVGNGLELEILELIRLPNGAWTHRIVYDAADTLDSAAFVLEPIALADGRMALAAGFHGWRAYDVRLLVREPGSTALQTADRDKLGSVRGAAVVRRADAAPTLVVSTEPHDTSRLLFPPDKPAGEPPGLYLYDLTRGRLDERAYLPLPLPAAPVTRFHRLVGAGDIDGDGRDDLVSVFFHHGVPHTLFHMHRQGGALAPVLLGHTEVLAFARLDDDAAAELIVNFRDADDVPQVVVLGVGDDPVPPVAAPLVGTDTLVDPDDDAWTRQAARVAALQGLGLLADAAAAWQDLAQRGGAAALRAAASLQAATLRARIDDEQAALPLFAAAARDPALAITALRGALEVQLRLGDYAAAGATLAELRASPDLPADIRAELTRRWDPLLAAAGERVAVDFAAPLDPAWTLPDPLALRRVPGADGLDIDTTSQGVLASLPIAWSGALLDLSVELTVAETEWSSYLEVALEPEAPVSRPFAALWIGTVGTRRGSIDVYREPGCTHGRRFHSQGDVIPSGTTGELHLTLRVSVVPGLDDITCSARAGAVRTHVREPVTRPLPPGGRHRLVIRSENYVPARLTARLHRIDLRGARVVAAPSADPLRQDLTRALVERDPVATLAALDRLGAATPAEQTWRAHALLQTGRLAEARALWGPLLAAPKLEPTLRSRLRAELAVYGPLLRELDPDGYPRRLAEVVRNAAVNHLDDPRTRLDLHTALAPLDADALVRGQDVDLAVACDLIAWRGRLYVRSGEPALAARDLRRAIAVAERLPPDAPQHKERWLLWLDLASVAAAAGDVPQARDAVQAARASTDTPLLDDIVRARPALAGL